MDEGSFTYLSITGSISVVARAAATGYVAMETCLPVRLHLSVFPVSRYPMAFVIRFFFPSNTFVRMFK